MHVVMLNALIAIMGDSFDRVCETQRERGLLNRANLLLEQTRLMNEKQFSDTRYFPRWLHLLAHDTEEEMTATKTGKPQEWAGRVAAMKNEVVKSEAHTKTTIVEANQRHEGLLNELLALQRESLKLMDRPAPVMDGRSPAEDKVLQQIRREIAELKGLLTGQQASRVNARADGGRGSAAAGGGAWPWTKRRESSVTSESAAAQLQA